MPNMIKSIQIQWSQLSSHSDSHAHHPGVATGPLGGEYRWWLSTLERGLTQEFSHECPGVMQEFSHQQCNFQDSNPEWLQMCCSKKFAKDSPSNSMALFRSVGIGTVLSVHQFHPRNQVCCWTESECRFRSIFHHPSISRTIQAKRILQHLEIFCKSIIHLLNRLHVYFNENRYPLESLEPSVFGMTDLNGDICSSPLTWKRLADETLKDVTGQNRTWTPWGTEGQVLLGLWKGEWAGPKM